MHTCCDPVGRLYYSLVGKPEVLPVAKIFTLFWVKYIFWKTVFISVSLGVKTVVFESVTFAISVKKLFLKEWTVKQSRLYNSLVLTFGQTQSNGKIKSYFQ